MTLLIKKNTIMVKVITTIFNISILLKRERNLYSLSMQVRKYLRKVDVQLLSISAESPPPLSTF